MPLIPSAIPGDISSSGEREIEELVVLSLPRSGVAVSEGNSRAIKEE
jgi:hypothetical protein